jgi:predicted component of type VI protein secretion system
MALPKMEAMLNTSYISPCQLHDALVELVSNLSPLYLSRPPLFMKGYNHHDIFSCLIPLIDEAQFYIDCIEQTYSIFPFQQKEKLFYLYLSSHKMQTTLYVGCVMAKGQTEDMVETWMMDAIIASDFAVDAVRAKRIRGARRKRIDAQTQLEMLPGRSVIVFEVPFDREYIALDQNLNIFNPNDTQDFRPTSLVLHIKKAQTFEPFALAG